MPVRETSKNYKTWWLMLSAGCILVVIGGFSYLYPWNAYIHLAIYSGFALILNGIFILIHAFAIKSSKGEKNWLIMESLLDVLFGATLILNPLLAIIAFPTVIGFWIFLRGIIKAVASVDLRHLVKGWIFILGIGVVSTAFGLFIILSPPKKTSDIIIALSIFSTLMGLVYIYDAFRFRKMEDTIIAMI